MSPESGKTKLEAFPTWIPSRPDSFVETRLGSISELKGRYTLLSRNHVEETLVRALSAFPIRGAEQGGHSPVKEIDISTLDVEAVKQQLASIGIPLNEVVQLIWFSDRVGISVAFSDFVQHYDDFWYPSRDDVWVTDRMASWLLWISHEEIMTFSSL